MLGQCRLAAARRPVEAQLAAAGAAQGLDDARDLEAAFAIQQIQRVLGDAGPGKVGGVITAGLGLFTLARPAVVASFLPVVFGLFILIDGCSRIGTALDLARAMRTNSHLKVLSLNGYYDMATPFAGAEYDLKHMQLDKALQANISYR